MIVRAACDTSHHRIDSPVYFNMTAVITNGAIDGAMNDCVGSRLHIQVASYYSVKHQSTSDRTIAPPVTIPRMIRSSSTSKRPST